MSLTGYFCVGMGLAPPFGLGPVLQFVSKLTRNLYAKDRVIVDGSHTFSCNYSFELFYNKSQLKLCLKDQENARNILLQKLTHSRLTGPTYLVELRGFIVCNSIMYSE